MKFIDIIMKWTHSVLHICTFMFVLIFNNAIINVSYSTYKYVAFLSIAKCFYIVEKMKSWSWLLCLLKRKCTVPMVKNTNKQTNK